MKCIFNIWCNNNDGVTLHRKSSAAVDIAVNVYNVGDVVVNVGDVVVNVDNVVNVDRSGSRIFVIFVISIAS